MLAKPVLKIVDLFQIPKILRVLLRLLTHASILTAEELEAAGSVLGPEAVQYPKVRIAEGGVMTLFRTINLPGKGHHSLAPSNCWCTSPENRELHILRLAGSG